MARDIAHGEISITLDIERLGNELRAAEAQVARSLGNIDRMRAEADISVETKDFRRQIAEARARLKELEAEKIDPAVGLDTKKLSAEIAKVKAQLKRLEAQKTRLDIDGKELEEARKSAEKLYAARRKQRLEEARYRADVKKRFEDEMAHEGKMHLLVRKRFEDEMLREGRLQMEARRRDEQEQAAFRRRAGEHQRALDLDRKRAVELEDLRLRYIKLHDEVERGSRMKLFDFLGDETARTRFAKTEAELRRVKNRIVEIGGRDVDFIKLEKASDSAGSRLRRMASSLGSVRLQMGFFSATLRQTAIGFTALGPVIFGLIGQISSLVGVLGTGLTGALAVAGAGAAGFGLSALGIGLIIKPLIGDLQDAMKASEAYGDAVRKYGKDSTQAQSAQEKLNKTLGDVGPETRKAFASLSGISDRWGRLTSSARPAFFETMASGIKAVNRLMPTFAQESVRAFRSAGRETQRWFAMLSSSGAERGIQQVMANFTESLPALNAGFRSLATMIGRVSVSASKLLPGLMSGFKSWSDNLRDAVGSGDQLDAGITRLVDHMRQVGRFAQSAGSMLTTFFNAGANEGANLLNTLTNIFDRWNAWMKTAGGQQSLANFFSQANAIGSQFVGTLAQMGVALFEFSQAFAPLSQGFITVIHSVSQLAAALMGLSGARAVVTGLGAALATAFIAGKVIAFAAALRGLYGALSTLIGLARVGSLAALFTTPLGPAVALISAVVGVASALSQLTGSQAASTLDSVRAAADGTRSALDALSNADTAAASARVAKQSATAAATAAEKAYNEAVAQHGKKSAEARAASQALTEARVRESEATQRATTADKDAVSAQRDVVAKQRELHEEKKKALGDGMAEMGLWDSYKRGLNDITDALGLSDHAGKRAAETSKKLTTLRQAERDAAEGLARSQLNLARRNAGIGAQADVVQKIGNAWARVRESMPKGAQKAIIQATDPKDAARAIQMADSLQKIGKGGAANRILLNTSNIDQAIAKMRKLRAETTRTEKKKIDVDANTESANRKMRNLENGFKRRKSDIDVGANTKKAEADINKVSKKKGTAKVNVTADASAANAAINRIAGRKIPAKKVQISANASGANTAISKVSSAKIPTKKFEVKANTSEADAANRRVQSFKDKTVQVKTQADTSGASAAQSAINSIPSNTNKYITIIERKVKASAQGSSPSDQPIPRSTASAGPRVPATDRRNSGTAREANTRSWRPGIYKRPTLLVGEERQDEYVIATNPAYRAANEGYLRDAAARFGYQLAPIEMAAKGKASYKPLKFNAGRGAPKRIAGAAQKFPRYDFLQGEISRWGDIATGYESRRAQDIEISGSSGISIGDILGAYTSQMGAYKSLRSWLLKQVKRMSSRSTGKGGTMAKERKAGNQANRLKKKLKAQRKKLRGTKDDKKRKGIEKEIAKTERALSKATSKRDKFRNKTRDANTMAGQFGRELNQSLPGQMYSLDTTIKRWQAIKDGKLPDPGASGGAGSDTTPMGLQLASLDKQRYDLFNQFGSNIIPGGVGGPGGIPAGLGGAAAGLGGPSFYQSGSGASAIPAGLGGAAAAGAAGAGAVQRGGFAGTTVNQNITIAEPPPDPHSFARALGWEAQMV